MMKIFKSTYILIFANVIFVACKNEKTNNQQTVNKPNEYQVTDKTIDSSNVLTKNKDEDISSIVENSLPQIDSITCLLYTSPSPRDA